MDDGKYTTVATEEMIEMNIDKIYEEKTLTKKLSKKQRVYNVIISTLSSITFGYGLTSFGIVGNVSNLYSQGYEHNVLSLLTSFAVSNIFIGGFISNIIVRCFPSVSRKYLLMISSIINGLSYLLQYLKPQIISVGVSRIFIGMSSGIVCAVVPGFLHENSSRKYRGFITCFHSIGISIGIVLGGLLGIWNSNEMYHIPMFIAIAYLVLNTILLCFTKEIPMNQEEVIKHVGLMPLLRLKEARKSLLTCTLFHLTQHLSGTDFVALFSSKVIGHKPYFSIVFLTSMLFAIPVGMIGSLLLDKIKRKTMMLISLALLAIVTLLMGSVDWYMVLIYFFILSYNLGVANVPWVLPTEIFPKEYFKSGNMIGISVNWLSAYILSIFSATIFEYFGNSLWYFFSGSMFSMLFYTLFFLKETRDIPIPQFQ